MEPGPDYSHHTCKRCMTMENLSRYKVKYVVKHKSAKLFMTYAVGKFSKAALNISHVLSTSSQRVSQIELVS